LRREEERRLQGRIGFAAGVATAMVASVLGLSIWALTSSNRAANSISRSIFATDKVVQSIARSPIEDESRANLLATTCDLLDSLSGVANAGGPAGSMVICAVERSSSRDRNSEVSEASNILRRAVSLAETQYANSKDPDDALAIIEARRALMARALEKSDQPQAIAECEKFIEVSLQMAMAHLSDAAIPDQAAGALQVETVLLAEKDLMPQAIRAVDASLKLRALAAERGVEIDSSLDAVATMALKAEVHSRQGDTAEKLQAAKKARDMFGAIAPAAAITDKQKARYQQVKDLVTRQLPK
jgi:hypothetical protein